MRTIRWTSPDRPRPSTAACSAAPQDRQNFLPGVTGLSHRSPPLRVGLHRSGRGRPAAREADPLLVVTDGAPGLIAGAELVVRNAFSNSSYPMTSLSPS